MHIETITVIRSNDTIYIPYGRGYRTVRNLVAIRDALTGDINGVKWWEFVRCHYAMKSNAMSLDHKRPISMGGSHTLDNIQVIHIAVNSAKGTMANEEFIGLCCEVAAVQRDFSQSV